MKPFDSSRRDFIMGGVAACALPGCRGLQSVLPAGPDLRFGVLSDLHVTTPESTGVLEQALRYFKSRDVDAVMISGDLTDWGLKSGFEYVKKTWDDVFGDTAVVPLFCTGNHDYDGWWYGDMTMEMHANGYSEDDAIVVKGCDGMAASWESVFGESYAPIRLRSVKGYDFVSCEYRGAEGVEDWLGKHGNRLRRSRPFFFFQHEPIRGTTEGSVHTTDKGLLKPILSKYSNCVAFTGHTHLPFTDDRLVWQDAFTVVSVPSLSYACFPDGHENGEGPRNGTSRQAMGIIPDRFNLNGSQGYCVSVFDREMVIERLDFSEEDRSGGRDWVVPLGKEKNRVPAFSLRGKMSRVPMFPQGARVRLRTRNTENRQGRWTIVLCCEFPAASCVNGDRVFDYEIRVVPRDGSAPVSKRFLSPAYSRHARHEPRTMRFWFDSRDLPQGKDYVVEVRAFNCWGKGSGPIVSSVWHSVPGLDGVKYEH